MYYFIGGSDGGKTMIVSEWCELDLGRKHRGQSPCPLEVVLLPDTSATGQGSTWLRQIEIVEEFAHRRSRESSAGERYGPWVNHREWTTSEVKTFTDPGGFIQSARVEVLQGERFYQTLSASRKQPPPIYPPFLLRFNFSPPTTSHVNNMATALELPENIKNIKNEELFWGSYTEF
jgi:hypothetical protein